MKSLAIIGAQWGDEGKGKITDLLGEKCDVVVRYQGGNNAGHTIIVGNKKTVLHLIPSGILHAHCLSLVAHGVVFDPLAFEKELEEVRNGGATVTTSNLKISMNCSVITSYHKILDSQRESQGKIKLGTTGRGIGPAYEDKVSRKGLKLKDLLDKQRLKERLQESFQEKQILFEHLYNIEYPSVADEAEQLYCYGQKLAPFLCDTFALIDQSLEQGKKVLYEGAQGVLLDIDYGTYPYVTSSNTSSGGIFTGAGIPSGKVDEILGIAKAYTTRVGQGPFPTELHDETGNRMQQIGNEFGATTGRRRRCGWIDLPLLRYAIKASNITSLALTKLDVLSKLGEIKVCYAYEYQGKEIETAFPGLDLTQVKPLYKSIKAFSDDFTHNKYSDELLHYISILEKGLRIPVGILAYGPERAQIEFRKSYF